MKKIFLFIAFNILTFCVNAQQFLVNNFNSNQYKSHTLMWAATQDFNGRIWFANNNGVVRFDGNNWKTFDIPFPVRNLVFNSKGNLFLACKGNFGFVSFKQDGSYEYISLNSKIEEKNIIINGDERIFSLGDEIYFTSRNTVIKIYESNNEFKIKILDTKTILGSTVFEDKLYLNIAKEGFGYIANNKFTLVNNGYLLLGKQISAVNNWNKKLLIATNFDGIYVLENNNLVKVNGTINNIANDGIAGINIINNTIFVGTFHNGVKAYSDFNTALNNSIIPNLPSNEIYNLSSDNEKNLWIAHAKGLTQVLVNIPVKKINTIQIEGSITNLEKYKNNVYISSSNGVISLNKESLLAQKIDKINGECWDIKAINNNLFVASTNGLYEIENNEVKLILANETILHIQKHITNSSFYALGENGCWVIKKENGVNKVTKINGFTEMCNSIYENKDGSYWVGTYSGGIKCTNISNINNIPLSLKTGEVKLKMFNNELLFINKDSVFTLKNNLFEINNEYSILFKNISNKEFYINESTYIFNDFEFKTIKNNRPNNTLIENCLTGKPTAIISDENNNWVATEDYLYKTENTSNYKADLVTSINLLNSNNKVFFSGFYIEENEIISHKQLKIPSLDYNELPIKIEFGINSFVNPIKNKYRYKIIGLNNNWSEWGTESFISLNGLSGGSYSLIVQAKNAFGVEGNETEFNFIINPPFYLSAIAYLIYLTLIALLVFVIINLYSKQLIKKNKILENKVSLRTQELEAEKQISEDLLLNILPSDIVTELKKNGKVEAKLFNEVTVLFTDFVNFTGISQKLSPQELVNEIHNNFVVFDEIIERNGLEKIKTIGDAYLAVCGLPAYSKNHANKVVKAAEEIRNYIQKSNGKFQIRIGIHSGPVIAGIVGVKKYAYDIWGDTVNMASRMESTSEAGKINISAATYELINKEFKCEFRGKINAKGKGEIDMYYVVKQI